MILNFVFHIFNRTDEGHVESLSNKDQTLNLTALDNSNLNKPSLDDKSDDKSNDTFNSTNPESRSIDNQPESNEKPPSPPFVNEKEIEAHAEDDLNEDDVNVFNKSEKRSMNRNPYVNPYINSAYDKYNYTYRQFEPPIIPIDPNTFKHSSVHSTGDDSREDIKINRIFELSSSNFKFNTRPIAWHYERFNSTNYFMVDQEQMITIWRDSFYPSYNGLRSNFDSPICNIDLRKNNGFIIQSIFFTRVINYEQVLRFAFIYRTSSNSYKLKSYEITGDSRCLPLYFFDLKERPIKLDYVSTYQFGSLAILFEHSQIKPRIEFLKNEHEKSTELIKVYANRAIDFESFMANGVAYLAVGYIKGVDVFKFDELITHYSLYEAITIGNVRDLKSFSIGFKNFLAIATSDNFQHIFTFRSGSLLRYQVLKITDVLQWQVIDLQTCKDDLLLGVVRNDNNNPLLIYTWDGLNKHFRLAVENIRQYTPHSFAISPFSQASFNYNGTAYIVEFDRAYQTRILAIQSSMRQVIDPVFKKLEIVSTKIRSLYNSFVHQQKELNSIRSILDLAVRPTETTFIDANQRFLNNIDVGRAVNVNGITKMRRAIWQDTSLTLDDTNLDLNKAQLDINKLIQHADNLKTALLNDAVFKDQPATIVGSKTFLNGISFLSKLNANSVHITKANSNPLSLLLNDLVYKDTSFTNINGEKIFLSPFDINGNLEVKTVNSIPDFFKLAAKRNLNQLNLNSKINFVSGFNAQNLTLKGRINNVDIARDVLYFDQGKFRCL